MNWKQYLGIKKKTEIKNVKWDSLQLNDNFVQKYDIKQTDEHFHCILVPYNRIVAFCSNTYKDLVFQV